MTRSRWQWRYLARGTVLHALDNAESPMARCGASGPRSAARPKWYGDGSRVERDRAATLPRCGNCSRWINGKGGVV